MRFINKDYGKPNFRHEMATMPYPMKVECVINMQERLAPIRAGRGEVAQPWRRDNVENVQDDQARFYSHLKQIVAEDIVHDCENVLIVYRESFEPQICNITVGECTNAN